MHKTNSATHLKIILKDVITKALDHLMVAAQVSKSLKKEEAIETLTLLNSLDLSEEQKELKFKVESLGFSIELLNEEQRKQKTKLQDDLRFLSLLEGLLNVLNDIIHPAYDVMPSLFDEQKDIEKHIELLKNNRDVSIERKMIDPICKCYSCKLKR